MSVLEKDFSEIIFNIIRSFNLILGYKSVIIAKKVLKSPINITNNSVEINFKKKITNLQKRRVLINEIIKLKKAYFKEVGNPAVKMISFVLKDYKKKYYLPKTLLS